MAKVKEIRYAEPVAEAEKVDISVDEFILALRDRKGFLKKDIKGRALRYFWCADDEDWFYNSGSSIGIKKKIEMWGWWIRKDLKEYLEFKKEEGWFFYLEIKKNENE